jgi:hypothetical protein
MRKFGKVFPLEDVVLPPELDVVELELLLLPPPPPQPAATKARPTAKVAATSHIPRFLNKSLYLPVSVSLSRRTPPKRLSARCIVPDRCCGKLVRPLAYERVFA